MKTPVAALVISFLFSNCFSQQSVKVQLHCNILGLKHETVRYYHPIEGVYDVALSNFKNSKAWGKLFPECVFIDPRFQLKDTLCEVNANSLRFYADISELLYIDWQLDSDTSKLLVFENFKRSSEEIRNSKYRELVNDYFRPYYMKVGEVSNYEYREFVYWVRDSLFKEKLYFSEEFSDEEVFTLLDVDAKSLYYNEEEQKWKKVEVSNREENRKYFHFKSGFALDKGFTDDRTLPVLMEFYLRPNERWYKRRELDVTKLQYRFTTIDANHRQDSSVTGTSNIDIKDRSNNIKSKICSVYPDTLGWVRDTRYFFNDPFSNMYFWHPAYNSYPVVGVSWNQAKAFCHWKQNQLLQKYPQLKGRIEVDLPTAYEYQNAIFEDLEYEQQIAIEDNEIVTDLLLDNSNGKHGVFHELLLKQIIPITAPVHFIVYLEKNNSVKWYYKKLKRYWPCALDKKCEYQEFLFDFILMRSSQNYLASRVRYLSNNVSEWMNETYTENYQALFKAYINYNCFASIDFCEYQRNIDINNNHVNPVNGKLIMGTNWFDERYEMILGVNTKGLYAKRFESPDKSHSTVGFRYVIRLD